MFEPVVGSLGEALGVFFGVFFSAGQIPQDGWAMGLQHRHGMGKGRGFAAFMERKCRGEFLELGRAAL